MEFRKEQSTQAHVHQLKGVQGSLTFKLPAAWVIHDNQNVISATNTDKTIWLSGGETAGKNISAREIAANAGLTSTRFVAASKVFPENIGGRIWQQQLYTFQKEKVEYAGMLIFTKTATTVYWFMLTAPRNRFSIAIQDVLRPLLVSMRSQ